MEKKVPDTSWDNFTNKVNSDEQYAKKIFTDYNFAEKEWSSVGIKIDPELHDQIREAYSELNKASAKLEESVRPLGKPTLVTKVWVWKH
jgi:hypothetical protein